LRFERSGGDLILINFNVYSSFSVAKLRTDTRTYVFGCLYVVAGVVSRMDLGRF
jgi:hypothetical protein